MLLRLAGRDSVLARARLELAKILDKKELYREAAAEWRKLAGSTPDSDPYHQMALDRAADSEERASQAR